MIGDRFNEVSIFDAVGRFHNLKQTYSVTDYVEKFEELMSLVKRNNPSLTDDYFVSSFVSSLKDNIQHHLQCYKPPSLYQAFWYAKRLEQAYPVQKKPFFVPNTSKQQKPWSKYLKEKEEKETPIQSIAELKAAGKCFKCREPWSPGHAKLCKGKQVFSVIVMESSNGQEEVAVVEDTPLSEDEEFQDAQ